MSLLPPFTNDGVLPVGDHVLTLDQLLVSPLVLGWQDGSDWDASPDSPKRQLPMWHKHRIEIFPHVGQFTGIVDAFGHELTFPSAFRQSRGFRPKGIVKIGGLQ